MMCKCLLENILQVEELSRGEGDVQVLPYVLALHAFCLVDPGLCTPASDPTKFVITLQPYLKSQVDSRIGAQLLESIIFIIDSVLPLIRKLPFSVTEDLEQDLKHMIVRHSFLTVVHACVRYPLLLNNPHSWLYRSFLALTYVHFYLDDPVFKMAIAFCAMARGALRRWLCRHVPPRRGWVP
ncbi:BnaC09g42330D [Brassica napus]|uniref:BnaC09g42330D protein n=2 Tax=Brassica TaxID=3705 RepID=A0A078GIW0_BRANA|nr:BnaC09g42330D [Brassica napus]VDD33674.1 unnamed protein product [Brassica oleracea]